MPVYDDRLFNPPAPLASVTLRNPANGKSVSEVSMLIDSGADVTLIPQQSVNLLDRAIGTDPEYEVMGFDGRKSVVQAVSLDLVFLSRIFRGRFLVSYQECGVVGRDILNHIALLLDGPRLVWDEQKAPGR